MKNALVLPAMLLGGAVLGAGSGYGISLALPPASAKSSVKASSAEQEPPTFVPVELLVPVTFDDGQLAGYANLKLQLRVDAEDSETVTARLPLLLNAVNLQTFRTPLAGAAGGRLPDLGRLRSLVQQSADRTLGRGVVRQIAIVEARTS